MPLPQRYKMAISAAAALLIGWGTVAAAPQDRALQSHEEIRQAATEFVKKSIGSTDSRVVIKAGRLDSRLKLTACDHPLEAFTSGNAVKGSRKTVGIRCHSPAPWTLYVPVTLALYKKIVVASRTLPRGTQLIREDIKLEERDTTQLHRGYLTNPEQVIGNTLKRNLQMNSVLLPSHIKAPYTIKRGERVTILAKAGALLVRMNGKALENGTLNEQIKVLNESSKRKIEATVKGRGIVEIAL